MNIEVMSNEQLVAMVKAMQAKQNAKISLKVTTKKPDGSGTEGAMSMYGLGRFPITLYAAQWERIIEHVPVIQAFIRENSALLSRKV